MRSVFGCTLELMMLRTNGIRQLVGGHKRGMILAEAYLPHDVTLFAEISTKSWCALKFSEFELTSASIQYTPSIYPTAAVKNRIIVTCYSVKY